MRFFKLSYIVAGRLMMETTFESIHGSSPVDAGLNLEEALEYERKEYRKVLYALMERFNMGEEKLAEEVHSTVMQGIEMDKHVKSLYAE